MSYTVICYALHDKKIENYHVYDDENDAHDFLRKNAYDKYKEELSTSSRKENVNFVINNDETAYLSSCNGDLEWTWEVIQT